MVSCAGARGGGWLENGGALGVIGSVNGSGLVSSARLCSGVFPIARWLKGHFPVFCGVSPIGRSVLRGIGGDAVGAEPTDEEL